MLGEIALYCFIILLLTGVYLSLWFKPSMVEVVYEGSYLPLHGVKMSEAFDSTLDISFDIRGGLLMRQIHHWAALFFVAAISVHLLRVFFTGRLPQAARDQLGHRRRTAHAGPPRGIRRLLPARRPPVGHRASDRAGHHALAVPVVGTYMSLFVFGGEFPGTDFIPRLYTVHMLLVPGIMLALITVHLMLVWFQKHTQFPGKGRTERNVVGYPLLPVYAAKAGGFFFIVFGVTGPDGWPLPDQPHLAVRALHPRPDHGGLAARLVHRLARGVLCASCRTCEIVLFGRGTSCSTC